MQSRTRSLRTLMGLTLSLSLITCSDGTGPSPTPSSVASAQGNAQTATVGQLLGAGLAVLVNGSDGQPFEGAGVNWAVASGGGSVSPASSTTDAEGMATTQWTLGTTAGQQSVTATVQGLQPVVFTATATPGAPAQVALGPASPRIDALQGTVQLSASLQDQFGNALTGGTFTWSSEDEAVVTVAAGTGLATGVAVGIAEVTATETGSGASGSVSLEVRQVPAQVEITPADPQVAVGGALQLSARVEDANDHEIPEPTVAWASLDETIATVDADGLLTGVAEGTAEVRATSGEVSVTTDALVLLEADDFEPQADQDVGGAMTVGTLRVPAGVTLTATSDLVITALEDVEIAGTITGDCVAIQVQGRGAATYSGRIANACAGGEGNTPPDVLLVNDGPLTIQEAVFTFAGNLEIKNDPTVSEDDFSDLGPAAPAGVVGAGLSTSNLQGGLCFVAGAVFEPASSAAREGADGVAAGAEGADAGNVSLTCRGDLQMRGGPDGPAEVGGKDGGAGGDAMNPDPGTDDASGRGGDGGDGGDVNVRATGDLTFEGINGGTILRLTDGGRGGDATVLGRDPGGNATAEGGTGGDGGNMRVEAGGTVAISPGGLHIEVGDGGRGGEAIANAGNGRDAGATAATNGGNAKATGGAAGHSVDGKLRARGSVVGRASITTGGGDGGQGGDATAVAGKGGDGNLQFPDGANGGNMEATGGKGGDARTKDITGTTLGTSGDGGDIVVKSGRGGQGADRCSIPDTGGKGGKGGSASGQPGAGGGGDNPGNQGGTTAGAQAGNGGDGEDGEGPGTGGDPGDDSNLSPGSGRIDEGPNFERGDDGNPCPVEPPQQALADLSVIPNSGGVVPPGSHPVPLHDVDTGENAGSVNLRTVGDGPHFLGMSPPRVGVGGGSGWAIDWIRNALFIQAIQICMINTFGVTPDNPITIQQRDSGGNALATTTVGDPTANGGCQDVEVHPEASSVEMNVPEEAVADFFDLLFSLGLL